MTVKNEKTIESITYSGSQSISRREIYMLGKIKIKLEIKADSVDFQCYANAYALEGLEWKLIYSIPYSEMKTDNKIMYGMKYKNGKVQNAKHEFESDIKRLKKYIREILE